MRDTANSTSDIEQKKADVARWKKEWLAWFIGAVVLTAVWGVMCLVSGHVVRFYPLWIIVIWGLLVALAPLFPARRGSVEDRS